MSQTGRLLEIADLFAGELGRFLEGYLPVSSVSREYVPEVNDANFEDWIANATPMKVFVVPMSKPSKLETRDNDTNDYRLGLVFVEQCTDAGRPSKEWMDLRVTAVDAAMDRFGDMRQALETENGLLWAQEAETSLVFDPDLYVAQGAFWSQAAITLREVTGGG
jgi:hypothetical protein